MGGGEKLFRHPVVGTMTLAHESLELTRTDGQRLVVYMAAPSTPDYDAMVLLDMAGFASATPDTSSGLSIRDKPMSVPASPLSAIGVPHGTSCVRTAVTGHAL